jgi:sirohydrochlorin ferrochelatase
VSRDSKTAVMLLAHGTREPEASVPVHRYAEELAKASGMHVEPCLREFIEPSIPTVTKKLVESGFDTIAVVPFFLFSSGHVTRDIQNDLAKEKERFPKVNFLVGEPLGFDPTLTTLLKKRLEQTLAR